eukprot:1082681-Amphidinium_carterae.1
MTAKRTEVGSSVSSVEERKTIIHELAARNASNMYERRLPRRCPGTHPFSHPENDFNFELDLEPRCTFHNAHAHNESAKRARKHRREAARAAHDEGRHDHLAAIVSRRQTRMLDPDVEQPIR